MAELVKERLTTKKDLHEMEERLSTRMQIMEERLNTQMRELEGRLNTQMRSMEERLNAQTQELEYKMTVRLGSMLVVAVGVMATLVKIL